jgi:hypothetical protein
MLSILRRVQSAGAGAESDATGSSVCNRSGTIPAQTTIWYAVLINQVGHKKASTSEFAEKSKKARMFTEPKQLDKSAGSKKWNFRR